MSIVITSKTIREGDRIQALKNEAIRRGIVIGLIKISTSDSGLFNVTIARKTGKMRRAFEQAVRNIINIKGTHTGKTIISWSEIRQAVISIVDYAKYHFGSRGFYVNPTTLDTFPMRLSRFRPLARVAMRRAILFELKKFGIQDRVTFTV